MRNARALRRSAAHSHASLVRELHSFAKQAGLPPIEGSTLVPAKKITKKDRLLLLRAQQEQELASTKLQGLFRVRTAKHETAERREAKEQQELEKGAFLIQRVFRGLGAKNKTTRMKEEQAAIWIQNRYRQMISRTKMADVRHNIQQHHREDVAATTLQNIARRRCERGPAAARPRVSRSCFVHRLRAPARCLRARLASRGRAARARIRPAWRASGRRNFYTCAELDGHAPLCRCEGGTTPGRCALTSVDSRRPGTAAPGPSTLPPRSPPHPPRRAAARHYSAGRGPRGPPFLPRPDNPRPFLGPFLRATRERASPA